MTPVLICYILYRIKISSCTYITKRRDVDFFLENSLQVERIVDKYKMHSEVIALKVPLDAEHNVTEIFVAPSYVVRALALFLAEREEEETINVKGESVKFENFSVTVGDSKKVVAAYECFRHYEIPLSNHEICKDIIEESSKYKWKDDPNYRMFEKWFKNRKTTEDEDEEEDQQRFVRQTRPSRKH